MTTAPYTMVWNASAVVNGGHTLGARARDAAGNTATATIPVMVNNPDSTPPTAAVTAPAPGLQVSGTNVTVSASATDNIGVVGVQFLLDGSPLGSEVTSAPYSITWNTQGSGNGTRALTARARDAAGNQTTSTPVNVFVWNVAAINIDAVAFGDKDNDSGSTVTTSSFSTTAGSELLLAFVGAAIPTAPAPTPRSHHDRRRSDVAACRPHEHTTRHGGDLARVRNRNLDECHSCGDVVVCNLGEPHGGELHRR